MPGNQQKPESLEMDSDLSPSCRLSDLSRGGSLESRSSSSRSRSFTLVSGSVLYNFQMLWSVDLAPALPPLRNRLQSPSGCLRILSCELVFFLIILNFAHGCGVTLWSQIITQGSLAVERTIPEVTDHPGREQESHPTEKKNSSLLDRLQGLYKTRSF